METADHRTDERRAIPSPLQAEAQSEGESPRQRQLLRHPKAAIAFRGPIISVRRASGIEKLHVRPPPAFSALISRYLVRYVRTSKAKDRFFAPKDRFFAPEHRFFAPKDRCFALKDRSFAPENRCFASEDRCFAPKDRCFAPEHRCFAPEDRSFTSNDRCFASND
jgi:hypothetical protein